MRKITKRINSFCVKRKNLITKLGIFLFIASIGIFLTANPVFAEGAAESVGNVFIKGVAQIFLVLANFFMAMTIFALRYFVEIAAYNNHTLADTVVLGWTMVRDVSNMFFVVILLAIAFGTILGLDQYEWKKLTVKLILAAIFINFSKLIAGVIIDAAHVFTITFLNAIVATAGGNIIGMFNLGDMMSFSNSAMNNSNGDGLMLQLLGGSVAAFLFSFIAMLTIGAYAVIMLSRMLVLWVLIILSPLAYLMSVLPATKKWANQYWEEFIKYVIAGPVMVFFLWLAFATMGSGNINQQIADNVSVEGAAISSNKMPSGSRESEISASLNKVTEWESMASFFIAVAFLFVGLQQVSKLGLVGGTVAGQATGIGTKWAMMATGAAAAGYLGSKALAVPGAAAKGTLKLASKPFTRQAREYKARIQTKVRKFQMANAQRAKVFEEEGGAWNKIKASVVEIGSGRKEKKVKDWEDSAEEWKEIRDKNLGTSDLAGAKARLDANIILNQTTRKKDKAKSGKMLERRREMEAKDGGDNAFAKMEAQIASSGVGLEIAERGRSLIDAKRKSKAYEDKGDYLRANLAITDVYAKLSKESSESFSGMSHEQLMAQANIQNKRVVAAKKSGDNELAKAEIQRSVGLQTVMLSQGQGISKEGFVKSLEGTGWNEELTKENMPRAFMTSILGDVVKAGDETKGIEEMEGAYTDKEHANNALRLLNDSIKKAAMDGGINMTGVIGHTIDKKGSVKYKINEEQDIEAADYFAERQQINKLESFSGFTDLNSKGEIIGISPERSVQKAQMYRGKNKFSVDNTHPAAAAELNAVAGRIKKASKKNAEKMVKEFTNMYVQNAKVTGDFSSFESYVNQSKELFNELNVDIKTIWKDAGRKVEKTKKQEAKPPETLSDEDWLGGLKGQK